MKIKIKKRQHNTIRISRKKAAAIVVCLITAILVSICIFQAKADEPSIIEEPTVEEDTIIEEQTIEPTTEETTIETTTAEVITEEEVAEGAWFEGQFYSVLWEDGGIITGYCPYCNGWLEIDEENGDWGTSSGCQATPYRTCAADNFPEGSLLMIEGIPLIEGVVWRVEDTGGLIDGNDIDVFLDCHEDEQYVGNNYHTIKVLRYGW